MFFNARDVFMIASNVGYLPVGLLYAWYGLWVDATLRVCVFIFSNLYHTCYRRVHDETRVTLDALCLFSMNNVFYTLLVDEIFANMAALSALVKFLPASIQTPKWLRHSYVIFAGILVWITTLWNGSFYVSDFGSDNNQLVMISGGGLFALLFIVHWWVYGDVAKQFYKDAFYITITPLIPFGICAGLLVWNAGSYLFGVSYFWSHPPWHFITQLTDIVLLLTLRYYPKYGTLF